MGSERGGNAIGEAVEAKRGVKKREENAALRTKREKKQDSETEQRGTQNKSTRGWNHQG